MTQLTLALRAHDLPPRWDGHDVAWYPWHWAPRPLCRRRRPDPCPFCASLAERLIADGRIAGGGRLVAWRCPDCRRDQVLEYGHDGPTWWDLDESDYGVRGSTA